MFVFINIQTMFFFFFFVHLIGKTNLSFQIDIPDVAIKQSIDLTDSNLLYCINHEWHKGLSEKKLRYMR